MVGGVDIFSVVSAGYEFGCMDSRIGESVGTCASVSATTGGGKSGGADGVSGRSSWYCQH